MKKILTITAILLFNSIAYAGWFSSEGKLRISSNYEGAEIFVDEIKKAETSNGYTTITVSEGEHKIRVFKEYDKWNYLEEQKSIYVGKDTVTDISMQLRQKLTTAGIEREKRIQEELIEEKNQYDLALSSSSFETFKKYILSCTHCKYKSKSLEKLYFLARKKGTILSMQDFISLCGDCMRRRHARNYLDELKDTADRTLYENALSIGTVSSYQNYLNNCKNCASYQSKIIKEWLYYLPLFDESFIDKTNGTIVDKSTTLTWLRCEIINSKWSKSTNTCKNTDNTKKYGMRSIANYIAKINKENYAGFSDWRLPTIHELFSITICDNGKSDKFDKKYYDGKYCNPSDNNRSYINKFAFPQLTGAVSSSKRSGRVPLAIGFHNSSVGMSHYGWDKTAILVRGTYNPRKSKSKIDRASTIPNKFLGTWNKDRKKCTEDESRGFVIISPHSISYSRTDGKLKEQDIINNNSIELTLLMSAHERDENWISKVNLKLNQDSLSIKHDGSTTPDSYAKCN